MVAVAAAAGVLMVMATDGDVHLTKSAFVAGQTAATVPVVAVLARRPVLARIRLAFVDIHLAVVAFFVFFVVQTTTNNMIRYGIRARHAKRPFIGPFRPFKPEKCLKGQTIGALTTTVKRPPMVFTCETRAT